MTKAELVRSTAKAANVTHEIAAAVINAALDVTTDAISNGDTIMLQNFGKLEARQHKSKTTHNFHTGESMTIPARKTIAFIPAQGLKERINGEKGGNV